jgi:hypothetical protein
MGDPNSAMKLTLGCKKFEVNTEQSVNVESTLNSKSKSKGGEGLVAGGGGWWVVVGG